MNVDYLIVGSGLTGSVIARVLTDAGRKVLVVDRREHHGGNVHDHVHKQSGIRIHTYGPHFFRTSSDKIWSFVNRFSSFYKYEAYIKSLVDNRHENWPIAEEYIQRAVGDHWKPEFKGIPKNFEEGSLSMMPRSIYEKFVKGYTEKQWGVAATSLSSGLAKRFDVRLDNDPRLVQHKYQGLPSNGYAAMMQNMFKGITVLLNVDYLKLRPFFQPTKKLIFTGPIDEFFNYKFGKLAYRGQKRKHVYYKNIHEYQPHPVVNYPSPSFKHVRTLEWKKMMEAPEAENTQGTVVTHETPVTPRTPSNFEYPFPDAKNQERYELYKKYAESIPGLLICGRLGEYRYYDMDQAIARAFVLAERILKESPSTTIKRDSLFAALPE